MPVKERLTMCKDVYRGAEMETKHTPGPWFQSHRKTAPDSYNTQVYTQNGEAICTLAWYPKPEVNGVVGTYREANARLIAACPTMYDFINKKAGEGDAEAKQIISTIEHA
jgi:hypothetical protein